eukprot:CAMPEP_0116151354 /NCGR_PEP_ID=MMETSP0329-20121206/20048_1 /TAXON_ID=697910 /ORGANISM="Pseudo-nitzschia arenysensis, Strain B593" /LENGTH=735 /DNA_ID=CAMNT_0003647953 /DNA_START=31 /DNA_END=2238 /DNA_ORIENTATION=-
MSLKNLKADLEAASASKSSSISDSNTNFSDPKIKGKRPSEGSSYGAPSPSSRDPSQVEKRLQSQQYTEKQDSNEGPLDQQEREEESYHNPSGPLHRPHKQQRSKSPTSRNKSVLERNNSALSCSSQNVLLPPLWTEGFARGVTNSIKRTVDDIVYRGSLLQTPMRKLWSSLSPEDILRPSSHGLDTEEDEEEYILGSGSFSKVTKVYIKRKDVNHDNSLFALKHLKGDLLPSKLTENSCKNGSVIAFTKAATELAREAFLLSQFDHPHIINILGWTDGGVNSYSTYRRHDAYFLVLELLQEETLDDRIDRWNQDDEYLKSISCEEEKRKWHFHWRKIEQLTICRQVASALAYIHSKNVVYRDLKPQNIGFAIGIDNEGHDFEGSVVVKLMDFGLARELPQSGTLQSYSAFQQHGRNPLLFDMTGTVGTIRYMAPEVCMNRPYGIECDIYSWSIVAHEILSQAKPYGDMTPDMYQSLVCQQGVRPPPHNLPSEYIVLLTQAWRTDPSKRMPFNRIKRQLDLFLQQEKLTWEAQELISEMPERCESPIFLSKSFAEENFGIQDNASPREARRGNKRSWYRANNDDNFADRDPRSNRIFSSASEGYHREHHTEPEYPHGNTQPYAYDYNHGTIPTNSSVYQQSPQVQQQYEATRASPPRRRPQPVTPDRQWNRPKQRRHERAAHSYYHNDHSSSNYTGYHNHDHYDNYHHYGNHSGSEHRHREVSPRHTHENWRNAYY